MGVVAVKVLFHNLWMPPRALELSAREAFVWSQLKHPNIVPFLGLANLAKISAGALPQLCLISPWMVEGNIMEYLARHEDTDRLKLAWDVAKGLTYLHELESGTVVHGDLRGLRSFLACKRVSCMRPGETSRKRVRGGMVLQQWLSFNMEA